MTVDETTETYDIGSMELYRGVHTAQGQIITQIPIEFCIPDIGLSLGLIPDHC